jgi:cellulose synthase operon protein C
MDASTFFRTGAMLLCCGAGLAEAVAAESVSSIASQTAEDLYAVAVGHYSRGQWERADAEFARFLQQYPEHPQAAPALFFRAEALVQQGRHADAKQGYLAFIEREPRHRFALQARFRAVEAAYLTEAADTARAALEQFLAEHPQNEFDVYVRKYLAELALAARDGPRAAKLFEQVLQRDPDGPQVDESRFGLGRALELQGDIESARIAYQTLAAAHGPLADDAQIQSGICLYNHGRYGQAAALFQAAIERFPDSELLPHARYWLGMCSVAEHDWQQAAKTLQSAIERHPQHALTPAMTFWLADTLRQDGDWPAADEGYARVVQNWPDCEWADDALQLQIQGALGQSQFERVVALGEQFRARFPDSPFRDPVAEHLGRGYLKQQQYARAIEVLQPLIETAAAPPLPEVSREELDEPPANAAAEAASKSLQTARYYLGLAYLGDRQYQAALDCLGQVQAAPEQTDMYRGVLLAQAMALSQRNRPADAIAPLRHYLAAQPQGSEAVVCRVQLLDALLQCNRLDEAFRVQAELADTELLEPVAAAATHRLAEAAFVAGNNDQAIRLFGQLVRDGQTPEWAAKGWLGLGWAQFREGDAEAAGEAFGELLQRYPDSALASEAAMMRAKTLEQRDRGEDALEAYLAIAATYGDSTHAAPAMMEAVRLLQQLERKAEVIPLLRRLIQEHPGFEGLDAALYELAWQLDAQGEGAEAQRLFERISDQYPDGEYWADTTYRLAERAARAGQYERAKGWLDRLIEARCADEILERALYLRGQLAASTQRWPEVASPLLALLEQFPDSSLRANAACWIAESLYQQKDYKNAARWFEELEDAPLAEDDAWNALIPLRRALMLTEQQQWQAAYALVSGLEERFPAFGQQYEVDYVLGLCLAKQDRPAEALRRLEQVVRSPEGGRSETAAKAQWLIGGIYAAGGELDLALKAYYRVETLYNYPQWKAAALLRAGHCHELRSEHEEAARAWRQVVANFAETPAATEAANSLERLNAKLAAPVAAGSPPSSVPYSARRRTLGEP